IAHNSDLRAALRAFHSGQAFRLVASRLWKPDLQAIRVLYVSGRQVKGTSIEKWERRLIHAREPVFNWPMPQMPRRRPLTFALCTQALIFPAFLIISLSSDIALTAGSV